MKKNDNKNKVVVLGGGINAMGIVRSFEKTDIPVIVFSWYKDSAMVSRFCKSGICPNPMDKQSLIDFLIDFGKKQSCKSILFATSDLFLMPVVEHKEKLSEFYHIPVCDWNILSKLIEKEYLYKFVGGLGIPCPKTINVYNIEDFEVIKRELALPLIIKPSVNINFSRLLGSKAFIIKSEEELEDIISRVSEANLCSEKIIVQEYIPGDPTELYTITSYANKEHEITGYSIGHKIRQFPPQTGTIVSGHVVHVEEILEHAEKFIKATKFYGISNIEFKKDSRDGSYKLMEINPRTGLWNLSVLESGVNLPMQAYNDVLGIPFEKSFNKNDELIWYIWLVDLFYAVWGNRKKGFHEYAISYREWRKSVRKKGVRSVDALFKWYDPLPFFKGLILKYR